MKTLLLATAFAVGSMGSAALAEGPQALAEGPQKLTEAQMDRVTAGIFDNLAVAIAIPISIAVCVFCVNSAAVSGDAIAVAGNTQSLF